jgi:Zn-dependent protease
VNRCPPTVAGRARPWHYPSGVTPSDPGTGGTGPAGAATRGFAVGRIGGVPIVIAPSWVLSVAVIAALGVPVISQVVPGTSTALAIVVSITLGVALGASVLAHELGHCLAARHLGMTVVSVRLYLLGGVSELARVPRSPREEAVIAAAGPAVSGAVAGVFALLVRLTESGSVSWLLVVLIALSNLVVALFNLLPALPLDGGRVLRAGVWRASGNRRAGTTAAVIGGYLIALLLAGWAVVMVIDDGAAGLLPAGVAIATALFVVVGAVAEGRPRRRTGWPPGTTLASLARPIAELPTETPVEFALDTASRRAVILTEGDGVARGLLDVAAARELAGRDPRAPASLVARALPPEAVLLDDDDPVEILERTRSVGATDFLLVDDLGRPAGVVSRQDLVAAMTPPLRRWWPWSGRHSTPATEPGTSGKNGKDMRGYA